MPPFNQSEKRYNQFEVRMYALSARADTPPVDILLIDNSDEFIVLLQELLKPERTWLRIRAASGGREALSLDPAPAPALILLDIDLTPDQSGVSYIARLRAKWPQTPLVALSVHDEPLYRRAVLKAGVRAFISKWTLETDAFLQVLHHLGFNAEAPSRDASGQCSAFAVACASAP
jgi:DNA-binding NarL/FixJ family response regulator